MDTIRIVHCYRPSAQRFGQNDIEAAFDQGLKETKTLVQGYIGRNTQPFHLLSIEEFGTIPPERDAGVRYRIVAIYSVHEDVAKAYVKLIENLK